MKQVFYSINSLIFEYFLFPIGENILEFIDYRFFEVSSNLPLAINEISIFIYNRIEPIKESPLSIISTNFIKYIVSFFLLLYKYWKFLEKKKWNFHEEIKQNIVRFTKVGNGTGIAEKKNAYYVLRHENLNSIFSLTVGYELPLVTSNKH